MYQLVLYSEVPLYRPNRDVLHCCSWPGSRRLFCWWGDRCQDTRPHLWPSRCGPPTSPPAPTLHSPLCGTTDHPLSRTRHRYIHINHLGQPVHKTVFHPDILSRGDLHKTVFHPDILSRGERGGGGGGQTRVFEMLRRGGINHQTVRQNKVKIQGGANASPAPPPPPPP